MKNNKSGCAIPAADEVVGHYGKVCLIKKADGSHELTGGTVDERSRVRKWCRDYAPFLVFLDESREELFLAA